MKRGERFADDANSAMGPSLKPTGFGEARWVTSGTGVLSVLLRYPVNSAMNVDLLEAVNASITANPSRFCAAQWAFARNAEAVLRTGAPPQGFRCCIAGHVLLQTGRFEEPALLRNGGFHTGGGLWVQAAEALALSKAQGRELFFPSQWDTPHKQEYYLCSQAEEADVATTYIDYFLKKHSGPSVSPFEVGHSPDRVERAAQGPGRTSAHPRSLAAEK